jgi:hypothetical protein
MKTGSQRTDSSLEHVMKELPCLPLDFGLLVLRPVQKPISVVLSHQNHCNLL